MIAVNEAIVRDSDAFFGYERPKDFRLEERAPQLFPTNVRPETLRKDAALKRQMEEGKLKKAQFLRFTSPVQDAVSGERSGECEMVSAQNPGRRAQGAGRSRSGR